MVVAILPSGEEDVAVFKLEVVVVVDEFVVGAFEDEVRLSGCGVSEVEVEVLVVAGEGFNPESGGVDPAEAGNVILVGENG